MAVTAASLVDGSRSMVLYPRENLILLRMDPGSPTVRGVVENRVNGDGELDNTAFYGGRTVALDFLATASPAAFFDELAAFIHPGSRPYLVWTDDEWAQTRRLRLRSDQWSRPYSADQAPFVGEFQVQWRAPDGTWEAANQERLTVTADIPSSTGMSFPMSFPMSFAATLSTGSLETVNVGNTAAGFVARLYGPCSAPRLINVTTGQQLSFTSSLALAAGQYVEVDIYNKTAYLGSDPAQSRLPYLDFDTSAWWQLQPGLQQIRFTGTAPSTGSQAEITYRPVWL